MEKYVFLEHKADVLFEARGFTFQEALENAAQALFDTIADTSSLCEEEAVQVEERAENLEDLANFVLADLLSEGDARETFFKHFSVKEFKKVEGGYELKGVAVGCEMKPENGRTAVKAVTHHETRVTPPQGKRGHWTIKMLLDI
ncbi:MAG: archease [Candidatus Micrarchaeia archaeon]|jgi:SHS2 domain-containing protein